MSDHEFEQKLEIGCYQIIDHDIGDISSLSFEGKKTNIDSEPIFTCSDIVEGTIVKVLDFGAIVEFGPGRDGMVHVSELKDGFVKKVEDVVKVGDTVRAKVIKAERGKIGLSLKGIPQNK